MAQQSGLGNPVSRVDGPLKVTGKATYAGEYQLPGLLHGAIVSSSVTTGRILSIDSTAALALPGVIQVFTHENRPEVSDKAKDYEDQTAAPGKHFRPLGSDRVLFANQPVALVVATSFEAARDGAALVKLHYESGPHETDLKHALATAYEPPKVRTGIAPPPKPKGKFEEAYAGAAVKLEAEYEVPFEHHNPMEPFATTCEWKADGSITVYDKTQGAQNTQAYLVQVFDLDKKKVRVVNEFVGGAFGSGLRPQHQVFFAVMAARALERSVRVVMTRDQMFTFTHRPWTVQKLTLGADPYGKILALKHEAVAGTSRFEDHQEVVVNWSTLQYHCENTQFRYELVKLDTNSPGDMRAPGAVIGQFAMESMVDELAYAVGMDPLQIRLANYTEEDENADKKFTSKALRECFEIGAKAFGWDLRSAAPRSMKEGRELIGWGMASAVWEALVMPTMAEAVLGPDGKLTVSSATADIGTGTYTIMAQTGADALGLDIGAVTAKLGDSDLPMAPVEGGSWGAASTCSAIMDACASIQKDVLKGAHEVDVDPLGGAKIDEVEFVGGFVQRKDDPSRRVSLVDAIAAAGGEPITGKGHVKPGLIDSMRFKSYTHSAVFCEVRVDEELGTVRVTRVVDAVAAGRILNPKTARSQILGGLVMGIGSALHEETIMDHRMGRFVNHNFADYHVPSNADIEQLEVIFVPEHDEKTSPIRAKGLGEIGIVGTNAAIANAIFHATGKRIRNLPITIDKILE